MDSPEDLAADLARLECALSAPPNLPHQFSEEYFVRQGYTREVRRRIEWEHADRLAQVFPRDTLDVDAFPQVLDYGCGPGYLVELLRERAVEAYGYDWSPAALGLASPTVRPFLLTGTIDRECFSAPAVVICREVLEHVALADWLPLLSRVCGLARQYVYLTTRFAATPQTVLGLDTRDSLDATHITMLTKPYLRSLLVLHGFRARPDLEAVLDWRQYGRCLVYQRTAGWLRGCVDAARPLRNA